ncbi:MAG: ATP-dependent DNA helicase RecG [Oscillospiraceae bacterium]|nr:ATP-dependent DNA helicase RecG [Oscillospiraceae bacterium]
MALNLNDNIRYLKGVGEKRAAMYHKLGIETAADLLRHFPRGYLDLRSCPYAHEAPLGEPCALRLTLLTKGREQRIRKGLSVWKLTAADQSGVVHITFFNAKYTVENLRIGQEYIFYGRLSGTLLRRELDSPQVFSASCSELLPLYPLTAGLTQTRLRQDMAAVLPLADTMPDPLPEEIRLRADLPELSQALRRLHTPETPQQAEDARRRFIFEELFTLSLGLAAVKRGRRQNTARPLVYHDPQEFYATLPFTPTGAQQRAIDDAFADLCTNRPMNRLIQGDVGSGKTLVAAACGWLAAKNGLQCALMAPTELLAEQHHRTLCGLLAPFGVKVGLLTGSLTAANKRKLKEALAMGQIDLCIGTHALLTDDVQWQNLALVITDEQHRFGVGQRVTLREKGTATHMMIMSATPIPRTLSLMIYGDLDVSVIDQLPPGRTPVETLVIDSAKRQRAFGFIRDYLDKGFRAYIVCPLVEQNEQTPEGLLAAEDYLEQIAAPAFVGYKVELLHGKMKPKDKEAIMGRFVRGETQLLVATTVIEVGVDVPSAVIMMVENAERFGLSQLHQLRGRVGRGSEKSWCILVSDSKGELSTKRLDTMKRTTDGFKIAEEDLKLRGPGDFFGSRQHGLPQLRLADLTQDIALLELAQQEASALFRADPELTRYPDLAAQVRRLIATAGELPN